jgi:hypothetical protein
VPAEKRLPIRVIEEDEDEDSPLSSLLFDFKDEIEERFNEPKPALRNKRVLIENIKTAEYKADKEEEDNKESDGGSNKNKRLIKKRKRDIIIP